jgi:hypothetical protein
MNIPSRMELPPTAHELAVERGETGEEYRLRMAAQADDFNDEKWSEDNDR